VTEWYENGPLGLEQGFTLAHRPGKANGQPLTVELGCIRRSGGALAPGGKALELRRKDGQTVLRYTGLKATGRDGTRVAELAGGSRRALAGAGGRWRSALSGGGGPVDTAGRADRVGRRGRGQLRQFGRGGAAVRS
jgi:hypothetical protein